MESLLHLVLRDTGPQCPAARELRSVELSRGDPERKHVSVAIREAFDIARRRLQDYARRQRGAVKVPVRQPRGRVVRLFPIDEYGYIEAEDGHEVYFHKRSVLKDAFNRLTVGSLVSFVEEPGEKGPQASTVTLVHPRRSRQSSQPVSEKPTAR